MSLTCSVGAAPSIAGAAVAVIVVAATAAFALPLIVDDSAVDGMANDDDKSP